MEQHTIQLNTIILDQHHVQIDATLENVSKDLFGVAFHLSLGDSLWRLLASEKGPALPINNNQLFLLTNERKTPDHEIIFGASLNNADRGVLNNGKIISFIIWTENAEKLDHSLKNIVFKKAINKKIVNTEMTPKNNEKNEISEEKIVFQQLETNHTLMRKASKPDDSLLAIYQILAVTFIILLAIFLLYLGFRHKEK